MLVAVGDVMDDDADLLVRPSHGRMVLDIGDDGRLEARFLDENSVMPIEMTCVYPETPERGG